MLILALLLLLLLAASFGVYRFVLYSPLGAQNVPQHLPTGEQYDPKHDLMVSLIEELLALPHERVHITSRDGLKLAGDWYPGQPGRPVHICCHGYRGLGVRDFCGGAQSLLARGDGVLLIHERAQGDSQGHTMTFGIREREDVAQWAEYCAERFPGTPLFLHGISMGAATVLMTSALPLPAAVKGILADCPYDVPKDIIVLTAKKHAGPLAGLLWPFLTVGAFLFGNGLRFGNVCCHEAVKHANVPILIVHGEDDRFVPAYMSEPMAAANPILVTRVTFAGAGHGMSYLVDTPRYQAMTEDFLNACLR
ncbi:MAG: alpha/beta hydrolase [Clostridia bacterium]|nr:alpha/beta hydrolase [Clostridia bacterium]